MTDLDRYENDPPEEPPKVLQRGSPQALDYETPSNTPASRWITILAHFTTGYPLLLLGSLYGQWLLSWWVLGHVPRPSLDDPTSINGASWMHVFTYFAFVGFVPAGCGAVICNAMYALNHRLRGFRLALRVIFIVVIWIGTFTLLRWDPARVGYWWID